MMAKLISAYLLLVLLVFITAQHVSASKLKRFKSFGTFRKTTVSASSSSLAPEFETHYYTQTIDHFNYKPESYGTFQQRYILNYMYWGGANSSSPIFVYTGEEDDVTIDVEYVGFIVELASRFNGLLLYIEHRYYGESTPFGPMSQQNSSTLGYFSSSQALADYAQIILDVKKNLSAQSSPVIAVGASYGGMLASWFRLKYPHVIIGALASSSPILYFEDITPQDAYFAIATKDFRNVSENCSNIITQSWAEIDKVGAEPNGLATLSNIFATCSTLNSTEDIKDLLKLMYMVSAQYNNPPDYSVNEVCNAIDGQPQGTYILNRIAAGLNASFFGGFGCYHIPSGGYRVNNRSSWDWQTCTEMVIPMGVNNNDTMFEFEPFDLNEFASECEEAFGVTPRPDWITTNFGGQDIKSVLQEFGSNIIFSNGLRDPYSGGGVLEDISYSIKAIFTDQGAHCLDVLTPTPNDPDWLVEQREKEIKIIASWIADYNAKLATKNGNM